MAITHAKTATSADDPAAEIQPSDWNAAHLGTNSHTHQSASEGSDLRATAAEVITGTNNTKFATPKAIKDAGIEPAVASTGWVIVTGTWVYASATTITVPSGAGNIYGPGDRFKLVANGATLQGYIVKVEDTLLTVRGDALTNHSFTSMYYSHMSTPLGYKDWYSYTPTGPTNCTLTGKFKMMGRSCHVVIKGVVTGTPNWTNFPSLPAPITSTIDVSHYWFSSYKKSTGINRYGKLTSQAYPTQSVINMLSGEGPASTDNQTNVTATNPITWVSGDEFILELIYEWGPP